MFQRKPTVKGMNLLKSLSLWQQGAKMKMTVASLKIDIFTLINSNWYIPLVATELKYIVAVKLSGKGDT